MTLGRVMIVDDDAAFREGLEIVLGDYCQQVVAIGKDSEALSLIRAFAPEVVLIDPAGVGLELVRHIKARLPHVRVVLISLFDEYLDTALQVGADGYLLKGCPTEDLVAALYSRKPRV